jgi:hypothetical protein
MKLLSWDQQLGLASPRPYAANQNGKTQTPSKNETGLDASRHTQVSAEGAEKNFLLDMLFHRMSVMAWLQQIPPVCPSTSSCQVSERPLASPTDRSFFEQRGEPTWTVSLAQPRQGDDSCGC